MSDYGMNGRVDAPMEQVIERTRAALADQGFGILTEIDVAATLKAKLDVDVAPQVILGACNAPLARQGLQIEPDLGLLLPCNVVVRVDEAGQTLVSALNRRSWSACRDGRAAAHRCRCQGAPAGGPPGGLGGESRVTPMGAAARRGLTRQRSLSGHALTGCRLAEAVRTALQ